MKSIVVLLFVMVGVIGGTGWIAQQWRLEATQYETDRTKQGEILHQQLESEGIKARAEIEAEFDQQGATEAAKIEAETQRLGRTNVAAAEVDRSRLENVQLTMTAHDVILPIHGTLAASSEFRARSENQNLSEEDRRESRIIYDLLGRANAMVVRERESMLAAMARAMDGPRCSDQRAR